MFDVYWCGFIVKTVIYLRSSLFAAATDHTSASYLWVNTDWYKPGERSQHFLMDPFFFCLQPNKFDDNHSVWYI